MSTEILTYVPSVDDALIPKWITEMRRLGMECEMHPEISLLFHSGFLPFKLRVRDSAHEELNNVDFLTGFEYYVQDFSLDTELAKRAKPSGLGRFFQRTRPAEPFASVELDEKLKRCHKLLTFSFGSADLFEMRVATVSSALIAELLGGISNFPGDGTWSEGRGVAERALFNARAYENSLASSEIVVHAFEGWV